MILFTFDTHSNCVINAPYLLDLFKFWLIYVFDDVFAKIYACISISIISLSLSFLYLSSSLMLASIAASETVSACASSVSSWSEI